MVESAQESTTLQRVVVKRSGDDSAGEAASVFKNGDLLIYANVRQAEIKKKLGTRTWRCCCLHTHFMLWHFGHAARLRFSCRASVPGRRQPHAAQMASLALAHRARSTIAAEKINSSPRPIVANTIHSLLRKLRGEVRKKSSSESAGGPALGVISIPRTKHVYPRSLSIGNRPMREWTLRARVLPGRHH